MTPPIGEQVRDCELRLLKVKSGGRTHTKLQSELDALVQIAVEQAKAEEA